MTNFFLHERGLSNVHSWVVVTGSLVIQSYFLFIGYLNWPSTSFCVKFFYLLANTNHILSYQIIKILSIQIIPSFLSIQQSFPRSSTFITWNLDIKEEYYLAQDSRRPNMDFCNAKPLWALSHKRPNLSFSFRCRYTLG